MEKESNVSDYLYGLTGHGFEINIVFVCFVVLIVFSSAILNSLLIAVITKTKILHTPTNSMIISMATAEILYVTVVCPFIVTRRFSQKWVHSDAFCTINACLSSIFNTTIFLSLMMIAIERCVAVSKPLQYSNFMTPLKTGIMIGYAWVHGVLSSTIPLIALGSYRYKSSKGICMIKWDDNVTFQLIQAAFSIFAPSIIIILCLIQIYREALERHRIFAIVPIAQIGSDRQFINYRRTTLKAVRTLYVLTAVFVVLHFPSVLVEACSKVTTVPYNIIAIIDMVSNLTHITNPIIIIILNKKFKETLLDLYIRCCHRMVQPGSSEL